MTLRTWVALGGATARVLGVDDRGALALLANDTELRVCRARAACAVGAIIQWHLSGLALRAARTFRVDDVVTLLADNAELTECRAFTLQTLSLIGVRLLSWAAL